MTNTSKYIKEMEITYDSNIERSVFSILRVGLSNLRKSNYLALQLAKRDIKGQYRQSFFGLFWSLLIPLSTALIWVMLTSTGTVAMTSSGMNYVLYVFTGTMAWSIITDSLIGPINSTLAMRTTLSKINFPKEALIMSSIYKTIFNTFIKLIVLVLLMVVYGQSASYNLAWFPLTLLVIILFGVSLGLLATPLGLLYGDVSKVMAPAMQILMYFSPVVFVIPSAKTTIGKIMLYNPFTPVVDNFRNALLGYELLYTWYYIIIGVSALILFMVALIIFKITIPIITERISS